MPQIRSSVLVSFSILLIILLGTIFILISLPLKEPETINVPPTAPVVFITPNPTYDNDTLICSIIIPSTDPDNDSISYTFTWVLNGSETDIITNTVPSIETSPNDVWQCFVTPFDGTDPGEVGSDTVVIQERTPIKAVNTPPTAPEVFIVPEPAYSNMSLFCNITTPSIDLDNDTITYFYEWFLNGSPSGFTGANLTSFHTHTHDEWTCVVTPFDGQNYGPSSSDVIIIQDDGIPTPENNPPTAPVVIISPDPAYSNNTLTCTILFPSTDIDNDSISYIYEWYLNGNLTNITGTNVLPNRTSVMDQWKCVVTPYDGIAYGSSGNYTVLIKVVVSGAYSLNPIISYICAFGVYSIFYSSFTFVDTGTTLTVQPLMNDGGYMTGLSASNGIIDVSFTYAGSCTDIYTLVGTFIDEDTWQATFTVSFTGMCYDCFSHQWILTGSRV